MPFKSDKQRRYLWSQKPDVARQIAHKQDGGGVYSSGLYDDSAKWWNERMAGIPQHRGYADDPDEITEMIGQNPDDKITFANPDLINPNVPRPNHYVDMATYYTPQAKQMGRAGKEIERMKAVNEELKKKAQAANFFSHGGEAMQRSPKKITQKDRYGNSTTVEFAEDIKPLDQTALMKQMMENMEMPPPMEMPPMMQDHPGEPRGTDTVPAWLTPGEFVVNAEAMRDPQNAAMVESINNEGRAIQQSQGGSIPTYMDEGGWLSNLKKLMSGGYEEGDIETITPPMPEEPPAMPQSLPMSPEEALLRAREGERRDVYIDSRGYPTVGIGHRLPDRFANRVGQEFSQDQIDRWFADDRETARADARDNVGEETWKKLNRRQKDAMTSMAFQLGKGKQKEFDKMLTAMRDGDWEGVRREAKDSNWYKQTPKRVEDVMAAFKYDGGPIYAFAGVDTTDPMTFMGDEWVQPIIDRDIAAAAPMGNYGEEMVNEIPNPDADLSSGWTPPAMDMPNEWEMPEPAPAAPAGSSIPSAAEMAMPDETTGEAPEEMGDFWGGIGEWITDTQVADDRNAIFNEKAAEKNAEAAAETLAELEERVANGQPVNSHTLEGAKKAAEHTGEQYEEAVIEAADAKTRLETAAEIDAEGVVAEEAALMAENLPKANKPGPEDDTVALEESVAEGEEEDNPSKPSEKGTQTTAEVEEVAKNADPSVIERAKGFFTGAFSDLFDGKELARMAVLYAGSRMLGYSHHGSLSWAAKNYIGRIDAKEQGVQKLLQSGKYTPASIEAYKKSGDISDLQTPGASFTPTGDQKKFVVNGKPVMAQKMKGSDGSYRWVSPQGVVNLMTAQEYDPAKVKGTPEWNKVINDQAKVNEGVLKDMQERFGKIPGKKDQPATYRTDMVPALQAKKVAEWAAENGVDAGQVGGLMEQAYHDMVNDSTPGRKRNLIPYMNSLIIRETTGTPFLFQTNVGKPDEEPKYVSGEKMRMMNANVLNLMGVQGKMQDKANIDRLNNFWTGAAGKWNELPQETKDNYNAEARKGKGETGFYIYAKTQLAKAAG